MTGIVLTPAELAELTGYVRPSRQADWLRKHLGLTPPRRADGVPAVTRAQIEAAMSQRGGTQSRPTGPQWTREMR